MGLGFQLGVKIRGVEDDVDSSGGIVVCQVEGSDYVHVGEVEAHD